MSNLDEKRSGSPVPDVSSADKHLAQDLPLNTDSELATVLDDTSEYMMNAKREGINPAFMAKVVVLNKAMAELGMGRYQWELFFTSGFGWMADNLWLQAISIVMPSVGNEWRGYPTVRMVSFALYCGLLTGAAFWGMSCDVVGRRVAWNSTLLLSGIFGILAGAMPNFVSFSAMIALVGFGAGGNLPVDGTMFLEFIPGNKQYLLTFLSIWWAIGQVVASLIAWVFIANYGCESPPPGEFCSRDENWGWRYTYFTLGALICGLWVLRFFVCPVYESPKFLASIGRDEAAVEVIHNIAKRNKVTVHLTVVDLQNAALPYMTEEEIAKMKRGEKEKFSSIKLVKNALHEFDSKHLSAIFSTPRLAFSTSLITLIYGTLGLAYPLFNSFLGTYLDLKLGSFGDNSINATYSAYTYQAACGIPGSFMAAAMVEIPRGGRKFAMAFFTLAAGIFLLVLTQSRNAVQVNALTCMSAFFSNAYYGVLFGYAPELFPTPSRGTGDALVSAAQRFFGLFAPIIAVYSPAADTPDGPVFASGAIYVATAFLMLFLPIETRGRTAL